MREYSYTEVYNLSNQSKLVRVITYDENKGVQYKFFLNNETLNASKGHFLIKVYRDDKQCTNSAFIKVNDPENADFNGYFAYHRNHDKQHVIAKIPFRGQALNYEHYRSASEKLNSQYSMLTTVSYNGQKSDYYDEEPLHDDPLIKVKQQALTPYIALINNGNIEDFGDHYDKNLSAQNKLTKLSMMNNQTQDKQI